MLQDHICSSQSKVKYVFNRWCIEFLRSYIFVSEENLSKRPVLEERKRLLLEKVNHRKYKVYVAKLAQEIALKYNQ